jgi:hypothetical protein
MLPAYFHALFYVIAVLRLPLLVTACLLSLASFMTVGIGIHRRRQAIPPPQPNTIIPFPTQRRSRQEPQREAA